MPSVLTDPEISAENLGHAHCTGTAVRDFVRIKDESALDEGFVRDLFGAPPSDAMLVFGGSSGQR